MKYKVGDKVRIKGTDIGGTIENIIRGQLIIETKGSKITVWPEEVVLIEGLTEEETLIERVDDNNLPFNEWLSHKGAFYIPDGYELKDENGNVINATKIVLEKKKSKYPNNFYHCVRTLGLHSHPDDASKYKTELIHKLQTLLVCRDAYWKIAGDEMGLGKPWEPDWCDCTTKYCIIYSPQYRGICKRQYDGIKHTLAFPTSEMRDAFKKNFDPDIEICKELL